MQNSRLWIAVTVSSSAVLCWGLWIMLKPSSVAQPLESLQSILMEHIERLPEVYRVHESYKGRVHDDTSAMLVYRYSSTMCHPCYQEDLMNLKEFIETTGRNRVLVLPAYPFNDRRSRMQINSETQGVRYRNIPSDSLALPIHADEGEKRYFAVIDTSGRVSMVFFPVRGRNDLTRRYFQAISRFFLAVPVANRDTIPMSFSYNPL